VYLINNLRIILGMNFVYSMSEKTFAAVVVAGVLALSVPFVASAHKESSVMVVSLNGQTPTGHCVAGSLTFVVSGVTGHQGGPYSIDVGNGLSTTTTATVAAGGHATFTNVTLNTYTPAQASNVILINLYHGSPTGNDSHITSITQCVAPPSTAVITVKKVVAEGSALPSAFTLHVKNGSNQDVPANGSGVASPFLGSTNGSDVIVPAGSYSVSEDSVANYTGTISGNCTLNGVITVVAGNNYTCTITNTYTPSPNVAPVATDATFTINEDTVLSSAVAGTDSNLDLLFYALVTGPLSGFFSTTIDSTAGTFSYTPNADYNGSDSFTFSVFDGALSDIGTISIIVTPVNDAPITLSDSASTNEDTSVTTGNVLSNDSDVDGDTLTVSAFDMATINGGTVTYNGDGTFDYTPALNFVGTDSFNYTAADGNGGSSSNTVTITVSNTNDAPIANADSYATDEDVVLVVAASGILENDTDIDSDSITAVLVTDVTNGALVLLSDGSFTYTPNADYNGSDSFTYKASDGSAESATVTVTITVSPLNDAPLAIGESVSTDQNVSVSEIVAATDVDGDTLTYAVVTAPANGTLTVFNTATGAFTYMPNTNYVGSDSFVFVAHDGTVASNEATVEIAVNPVLDVCTNIEGNQASVPEGYSENDGVCTENSNPPPPPQDLPECSDGIDNDGDGRIDYSDDNSCSDAQDDSEGDVGGWTGGGGGGSVLGASTGPGQVLGVSCGISMDQNLRRGSAKNRADQVSRLQTLLNKWSSAGLPVTGTFGPLTEAAVKKFQTEHAAAILAPWSLSAPTGLAYLTTIRQVNLLECPELTLALPALVPWSQNPNAQ
jgi:VCBS repeat-containing protein